MAEMKVEAVNAKLSHENGYWNDLEDFYKVFGDATRLEILTMLSDSCLCVSEISKKLELSPSVVSHQLKGLRAQKLVMFQRSGRNKYYYLSDEHVREILSIGRRYIAVS